jgi:organic hydroperoxide reductase OsmC/OhrA
LAGSGRRHSYRIELSWTGNRGPGTISYRGYSRDHVISAPGKPDIAGASDPAFLGDATRWNPEEMLVASLSACHQLWYLHLCADAGIHVMVYEDHAVGEMEEITEIGGRFVSVELRPRVTVPQGSDVRLAEDLHLEAHGKCYIANSVNFPVTCAPVITTG